MFFKQIKMRGDNFSYIIADENTKEAAVVDPGFNDDEIKSILDGENMKLLFVINTHDHIDHVLGDDELSLRFGAKTVAHRLSKTPTAVRVDEGDLVRVGSVSVKVIYTPGHSVDSICLLVNDKKLLTGDTLYVGSIGSTGLSGGDSKSMYDSLFNKLLNLGDDVEVYPRHDRGARPSSTLGEEKRSNKALQSRSVEEFIESIKQP
jgi:glyoxylase-like metal-dependent hydrolase (beta-lactamase superfamily II)